VWYYALVCETDQEVVVNKTHPRVEAAVAAELARFARIESNIEAACEDGRISEHDRDERIARAEQWTANVVAHLRGEPRPKQRVSQPLDDPDAGRVG
jgi:hypothetical protein